MKRLLVIFSLFLMVGCSPKVIKEDPLGYSYLPKFVDLDTIGPKIPASLDPSTDPKLEDYSPIAVMPGQYLKLGTKDTLFFPHGTLFSNMKTAKYIFFASEYDRLNTLCKYDHYEIMDYYDRGKAAETRYQEEIVALRKSNQRSWLEQNIGYIGFGVGILTTVLTEYMVIKASK
jgi:hypothetical protein